MVASLQIFLKIKGVCSHLLICVNKRAGGALSSTLFCTTAPLALVMACLDPTV